MGCNEGHATDSWSDATDSWSGATDSWSGATDSWSYPQLINKHYTTIK